MSILLVVDAKVDQGGAGSRPGTMNTSIETNTDVKKQPTAWNLFMKRVLGLTGQGMQFSSFLKARKDMAVWTDAEILAAMPEWRTAKELEPAKEPKVSKKTEVPTPSEDPQAEVPVKTKASKKTEVPKPSEDPLADVPVKTKKVKVKEAVVPLPSPAPVVAPTPVVVPVPVPAAPAVQPCAKDSLEGGCTYFKQNRCNKGDHTRHPRTVAGTAAVTKAEDPVPATTAATAANTTANEFHLNEAKKKVVTAKNIADKAEIEAKRATERAEDAMKVAMDLKAKATAAEAVVADARAVILDCQKDVIAKTAEFEKATAAAAAAASAAATEPDSPSDPIHLRRKKIPKHIKTLVWNKYIGADVAQANCVSCRDTKITNRSFHCGHVIAESKGGDMTINNLRPICDACNGSMGVQSMNEFTKEFFGWVV
jgi:hypothetical protein